MISGGKDEICVTTDGTGLTECSDAGGLSEETIDITTMFISDVSASGSFDLGRSQLSFFEKFLEAMPIPTLLVDESCHVIFANRACNKVAGDRSKLEGNHIKLLFPGAGDVHKVEKLIKKVLHSRMPLIAEGVLGVDQIRVRGRIHLRSLRVKHVRTVLVVIEDLRPTSEQP